MSRQVAIVRPGDKEMLDGLYIVVVADKGDGRMQCLELKEFEKEEAGVEFVDNKIQIIKDNGDSEVLIDVISGNRQYRKCK